MNFAAACGVVAFCISIVTLVIYVQDIFRGNTKPERATWWIWSILNVITFSAQWAAGGTWSLLYTASVVLAALVPAILSLKYGYGTFRRKDFLSILTAIGGVVVWRLTKQPFTAIFIVFCIDILGYWLTYAKSWEAPFSESYVSWVLSLASGTFGILAVGKLEWAVLFYPAYVFTGNFIQVAIISYRRRVIPVAHTAKK